MKKGILAGELPTKEEELLIKLIELVQEFHRAKPTDRTELARRYAVTITELEKATAYFATFCTMALLDEE